MPNARQVEGGYARRGDRQGARGRGRGGQMVEDDKESSEDAQMTRERVVEIVWGKPKADAMSILITNSLTCRAPSPL